jgi:hypothetical protein
MKPAFYQNTAGLAYSFGYTLKTNSGPEEFFNLSNHLRFSRVMQVEEGAKQLSLFPNSIFSLSAAIVCLGDCHPASGKPGGYKLTDEAEVTLGDETYDVLLKAITPYPSAGDPSPQQKVKQATLVISRK